MWIRHPYADIRCCPKNPTHIDFYVEPQLEDERGTPDYTIEFKSEEARDKWFNAIESELDARYLVYS